MARAINAKHGRHMLHGTQSAYVTLKSKGQGHIVIVCWQHGYACQYKCLSFWVCKRLTLILSPYISACILQRKSIDNDVVDDDGVCIQLQFLFELPVRLQKFLDTEAYSQAVRYDGRYAGLLHSLVTENCWVSVYFVCNQFYHPSVSPSASSCAVVLFWSKEMHGKA